MEGRSNTRCGIGGSTIRHWLTEVRLRSVITDEALQRWEERKKTGKRGRPRQYSNLAIETALTLREVFHLPLRQVEGFLGSILLKGTVAEWQN